LLAEVPGAYLINRKWQVSDEALKVLVNRARLPFRVSEDSRIWHRCYLATSGHERHRARLNACAEGNYVEHPHTLHSARPRINAHIAQAMTIQAVS
jgi:hypothetical protein